MIMSEFDKCFNYANDLLNSRLISIILFTGTDVRFNRIQLNRGQLDSKVIDLLNENVVIQSIF